MGQQLISIRWPIARQQQHVRAIQAVRRRGIVISGVVIVKVRLHILNLQNISSPYTTPIAPKALV